MPKQFNPSQFSSNFGRPLQKGLLQIVVPQTGKPLPGGYEDGDIRSALNWRHVRYKGAERVLYKRTPDRKLERINAEGFLPVTDALKDVLDICCTYRMERLNATQARLVRCSDEAEIIFNTNQSFTDFEGRDARVDIAAYFGRIARTLRAPGGNGKPAFGTSPNNLIVYGSKRDFNHDNLDASWAVIENKLGALEADIDVESVFGDDTNYRRYLVISTDDFTDDEASLLTEEDIDLTDPENPVTLRRRKRTTDWRILRDIDEAAISNRFATVKIQNIRKHVRSTFVSEKV